MATPLCTGPDSSTMGREFPGCSVVNDMYDMQQKLGEGTFGEVWKGVKKDTHRVVALKKIFLHNEKEGFPLTALREIKILKCLDNTNVIELVDMSIEPSDQRDKLLNVHMVTPYMEHDLCGLLQNPKIKLEMKHIKGYMKQILQGTDYIHRQRFLHRDIKTANILIDDWGTVKIADFGLARKYEGDVPDGSHGDIGKQRYTQMVVTRWYRPIELVLGLDAYTTAIDIWGVGCVFGEMFKKKPILPGSSDTDQGNLIFKLLGTPTGETEQLLKSFPNATAVPFGAYRRQLESQFANDLDRDGLDLLAKMLELDPRKRITALKAQTHAWFLNGDRPAEPGKDFPKFESSHEMTTKGRDHVPHAPNVDNVEHIQAVQAGPPPGVPRRVGGGGGAPRPHHGYRGGGGGGRGGGRGGPPRPPYRDAPQPPYRKGGHHPAPAPPYRAAAAANHGPAALPNKPPVRGPPPLPPDNSDDRPPREYVRGDGGLNYDE